MAPVVSIACLLVSPAVVSPVSPATVSPVSLLLCFIVFSQVSAYHCHAIDRWLLLLCLDRCLLCVSSAAACLVVVCLLLLVLSLIVSPVSPGDLLLCVNVFSQVSAYHCHACH